MQKNASPGMKRTRVPFTEKLRPDMTHEIAPDRKGRGTMLLPTPMLVAVEIASVPEGSLVTVPMLRSRLAERHGADLVCPLMTGIFFNIIAGAAEEQLAAGGTPVAPYWRVVLEDGTLSPKTPDGPERHAERLRTEGHMIESRGGKLKVTDFKARLAG